MKLRTMVKVMVLGAAFLALGACGGGGGGVSPPPASTACVLGTSTLGSCTL